MKRIEQQTEVARVRRILGKPSAAPVWATCGTCSRRWDDAKSTELTPTPSGRCPFEYAHGESRVARGPRNRLTLDKPTLFVDQYGGKLIASTAKELIDKAGGSKARKQYVDKRDGGTVWNGYIVGQRWFTALKWREVPA